MLGADGATFCPHLIAQVGYLLLSLITLKEQRNSASHVMQRWRYLDSAHSMLATETSLRSPLPFVTLWPDRRRKWGVASGSSSEGDLGKEDWAGRRGERCLGKSFLLKTQEESKAMWWGFEKACWCMIQVHGGDRISPLWLQTCSSVL